MSAAPRAGAAGRRGGRRAAGEGRRHRQADRRRDVRRRRAARRAVPDAARGALPAPACPLHARRSRAAARRPSRPGARADGGRRSRPQPLRHLSDRQGPAGAGRGRRALSRRGGLALVGDADDARRHRATTTLPIAWEMLPPVTFDEARRRRADLHAARAGQRAVPRPRGARRRRWRACARGARPRGDRRAHRLRRARLYRARGRLCAARRRPHRDRRLHPDAVHGPRRDRADPGPRARAGAHRADRDRRRLRRQARSLGAAADRARRVDAATGRCAASTRGPESMAATTKRHPVAHPRASRGRCATAG